MNRWSAALYVSKRLYIAKHMHNGLIFKFYGTDPDKKGVFHLLIISYDIFVDSFIIILA